MWCRSEWREAPSTLLERTPPETTTATCCAYIRCQDISMTEMLVSLTGGDSEGGVREACKRELGCQHHVVGFRIERRPSSLPARFCVLRSRLREKERLIKRMENDGGSPACRTLIRLHCLLDTRYCTDLSPPLFTGSLSPLLHFLRAAVLGRLCGCSKNERDALTAFPVSVFSHLLFVRKLDIPEDGVGVC